MNNETTRPHSVFIQDRSRAELTGIREVESFNETGIELLSHDGAVAIEGEMLKIDQFSVETGKISVIGRITGIFYYEKQEKPAVKHGGLFARRQK